MRRILKRKWMTGQRGRDQAVEVMVELLGASDAGCAPDHQLVLLAGDEQDELRLDATELRRFLDDSEKEG